MLYEHGKQAARGTTPVGNVVELGKDTFKGRRSIVADAKFWDDPGSAGRSATPIAAQAVPRLVDQCPGRRLVAPLRGGAAVPDPTGLLAETVFRTWELVELSVTSVPGNANCITTEVRSLAGAQGRSHPTWTRNWLI